MKKIIAIISALLLLIPLSAFVSADDTVYTEGTLHYMVENESITVIGCFGKDAEVTVPAMIAGIPVNTIASGAFTGNSYIKKLNLPDTITVIQEDAIDPGISVIYNANTDHPQDTPTDLIKTRSAIDDPAVAPTEDTDGGDPESTSASSQPGESGASQGETTGKGQTPSDPSNDSSKDPGSSGSPAETSADTEFPGTPMGGGDVDDTDDDVDVSPETADGSDALPESGDATGPAETGKDQEGKTDGKETGKENGSSVLAWAIPCGVAGAGGIAAAAVLIGKKKKKGKDTAESEEN